MNVTVNTPRTPVTENSNGIKLAALPNVCKMPGPPAPFVPTPLPNIGKSDNSPQGFSTSVTVTGKKVAIKGASFKSTGDVASQGTGGGLISASTQDVTEFVGPGSMNVKIEGKNVQLLGDIMTNNKKNCM
ncbi:MAG TPA: PAAR-like domain-containing protein [Archangium sp.]|uniref:PAAR-like domain-containing protein n=1 Tax=Archangium sp. TaxID=1872627 RepID=UPI002E30230E|nr:PAAR-like domain-containing protein [Archangium sp.]HEX5745797.1 PAAR-like domain-containing protein [Archangium sp.]